MRAWRDVERSRLRLKRRLGLFDAIEVAAYAGYGTPDHVRLLGRVLERGGTAATARDSAWRNFRNTLHMLESDEIPGARVRAYFGGRTWEATTDDEGYFGFELTPNRPLTPGWHEVVVELLGSIAGGAGTRGVGRVLVPPPIADLGVISDVDDTVVRTAVTELLMLIRIVFFTNAYTRASPRCTDRSATARAAPARTRSFTSRRVAGACTRC